MMYEDIFMTPALYSIYPQKVKHEDYGMVLLVKCLPLKPDYLSSILIIHVIARDGGGHNGISGSCWPTSLTIPLCFKFSRKAQSQ